MKISNIFNLNKTQAELDFVNIDTTEDIQLFIDPFFLSLRKDAWSKAASNSIRSFFNKVIELSRAKKNDEAKALFKHLGEPNYTCLGMSKGNPRGRGVGSGDTDKIFENIFESKAMRTGLIQDMEDSILFVDRFGKDKLSDMATNIILKHLISYTQSQCQLHGIQLQDNVASPFYWNSETEQWETEYCPMLVIDRKKILLVPKAIVSFCKDYTPEHYYDQFVLDFLQHEELSLKSALVQQRKKSGINYVTKKSLTEKYPNSKEFLREFTAKHPEILQRFKGSVTVEPLDSQYFEYINYKQLAQHMIQELIAIKPGIQGATAYQRYVAGILHFLFYPNLINPKLEFSTYSGRKRVDITFENAASDGIFYRLSTAHKLTCPYLYVECKNYTDDIANNELDQLSGRFGYNSTRVGIIMCRDLKDFDLFLERCKDTFKADRGLVIPITDKDLISLLSQVDSLNPPAAEQFLSDRVRMIVTG